MLGTFYTGRIFVAASALAGATAVWGCRKDVQALSPQEIEQRYGVPGAYTDTVTTPDGSLKGTVVPVTLANGRRAQLIIPTQRAIEPHAVYLRDNDGLHPLQVEDRASRDEVRRSPSVVARRTEPAHPRKRSWEKEALTVGGSSGAGAAVGAVAGGGKGAAIGGTAGGIGGLIYDLTTKSK